MGEETDYGSHKGNKVACFRRRTGSSKASIEDALRNAISRASKTVPNMRWVQVVETRGFIEEGKVFYWQVTMKIGAALEG